VFSKIETDVLPKYFFRTFIINRRILRVVMRWKPKWQRSGCVVLCYVVVIIIIIFNFAAGLFSWRERARSVRFPRRAVGHSTWSGEQQQRQQQLCAPQPSARAFLRNDCARSVAIRIVSIAVSNNKTKTERNSFDVSVLSTSSCSLAQ